VHRLSPEQTTRYRRDGYLFPLQVLPPAEAAALAAEVGDLAERGVEGHRYPWHQKTYLLLPSLDALLRDERLTDAAADVLGEDLLALSADVFVKPPRSTQRITWHQDVNYWQLEPLDVLTAWVALTPATEANGCMRYAAGGHRGRIAHVERPGVDNMLTRGQELAVTVDEHDATSVTLAAGEVAFHHALAPHASGPNLTDEPRIGFAIRYAATSITQLGGPPISARTARGTDRHRTLRPEHGPDAALSADALAEHRRALAPHERTGYSTV
jgi:ectoine hydroxylase-related dioxygenase (phytanoyl-CoA dioxygenase family)